MKVNHIYAERLKNNDFVDRLEDEVHFTGITCSEAIRALSWGIATKTGENIDKKIIKSLGKTEDTMHE